MESQAGMKTSPITTELYSIDWAVRFDEFRKFDEGSHSDLNELLSKIEQLVVNDMSSTSEDTNNIEVLRKKFNTEKTGSLNWHRLSIIINIRIIQAAMPKGLTATATLSAMQIMEHIWKVLDNEEVASNEETSSATAQQPSKQVKPKKTTPITATAKKKKTTVKSKTNTSPQNKLSSAKKTKPQSTENVVIKKLADEAGLDENKPLATQCYEVASALAQEYPEYTLTAIRVMTAEKLGVTRQFIENLDIKPARFKNA